MIVDIQAQDFAMTASIRNEVETRIAYTLGKRSDAIRALTVRLGDVNGPRGGRDKYCRVVVEITGQRDVFVEDVEADLYTAIYRAVERANRTVTRLLARQRPDFARAAHRLAKQRHRLALN